MATAAELRLFAIESGRSLAGINGGTLQGKKLRGYSNVRGLVLDGTFDFGSATLTVRGTGAAHGKVRLTVDRLVGTLGGKHVVARLY